MCEVLNQFKNKKKSYNINMANVREFGIQSNNISCFWGQNSEDVTDWLRQFKNFKKLYGLGKEKLHLYASSYLRGEAGKYYDSGENPPKNFENLGFCCLIDMDFQNWIEVVS